MRSGPIQELVTLASEQDTTEWPVRGQRLLGKGETMESRIRWFCASTVAAALALGGLTLAQAQQERKRERQEQRSSSKTEVRTQQRTRSTHEVRRISTVVGGSVQFASGGTVGEVQDVIISDAGCIDYIIVTHGDLLVPIPWTVATVSFGDEVIIRLDIDRDRFEQVPTFTSNEFHVLLDVEFTSKVNSFFRVDSTRRETRTRERLDSPRERSDEKPKRDPSARPDSDDRSAGKKKDADSKRKTDDLKKKSDDSKRQEPDRKKDEEKAKDKSSDREQQNDREKTPE
jgi:hypothetical protein